MKVIKIDFKNPKKSDIDIIASYFKAGKIVVYPTDTIYGIGCIANNKKAVDKIRKIKKRKITNPFLVLVGGWCQLKNNFYVSKKQNNYLREIWFLPKDKKKTRPTSVLLKKRDILSDFVSPKSNVVAVRLPSNKFLIKLIKKVSAPIVSTSANISGQEALKNPDDIDNVFKNLKPDLVVNAGIISNNKSSKLVDIIDINNKKILRK